MSLQKYLQTIKSIDTGNIYVENVRSVYKIPRFAARVLCEMAVIDNVFVKRIGLICPSKDCNQRIIADYSSYLDIPEEVVCHICEAEENDTYVYKTSELDKIEFYQLKK